MQRIQRLDEFATVRFNDFVVITKESGGEGIRKLLTGEKLVLIAEVASANQVLPKGGRSP